METYALVSQSFNQVVENSMVLNLTNGSSHYGINWPVNTTQLIIWLMGTIGNTLAIIFFLQAHLRSSATCFLFCSLSICDFIVVQEHMDAIFVLAGTSVLAQHTWTCKIFVYLFVSFRIIAVWMLVAIGTERMVAVIWPHRIQTICTIKRAKLFVSLLIVIVLLIQIPQIIATDLKSYFDPPLNKVVRYCWVDEKSYLRYYMDNIEPWIAFSLYSVLPFIFLLTLNIIIIHRLHKAHKERMVLQELDGFSIGPSDVQLRSMTAMLLCISFSFIILTTPWCVYIIISSVSGIYIEPFREAAFLLIALNHSVNFALYCLSGRYFRKQFIKMVNCNQC